MHLDPPPSRRRRSRRSGHAILLSLTLLIGACGADTTASIGVATSLSPAPAGAPTAPDDAPATPAASDSDDGTITGVFDVGGHGLFIECRGTGSPTVIYLHGSITERAFDPHVSALSVQQLMMDDDRTCLYDRRNLGHSDTVDAVQTPDDALADLRGLLDAAGVEPPYVLLGASFGGMLAYLYANTSPDEVVGMVLLDAMFPDELTVDHLFPPEERFEAFDEADKASLERISHFAVLQQAQPFIGHEPAIPVTYLASQQEPYDVNDYGIPEYDAQILDLQAGYVDRFSPGALVWVDAPHYMEPVIPSEIAEALRSVIDQAAAAN